MNTRDKILATAKNLILKVGYNAFSFSDISVPLGIKNAAIHYHFPGKEALGCAVIRKEHENVIKWKNEVDKLDPWQKLERFFRVYDKNMVHNRICMVGSISSDLYAVPESMRDCLHAMVVDINQWLTELLEEGRRLGTFQFHGPAEGKAAVVVTSLAAGLQIARVLGSDKFEQIKNQIKLDITPTKDDN
ncbi:TetR/AcrR family transcriptional regulator [Fulvivirga kasyanovii]|uniref:TetR/AcrR family transcriptional regulator n=1 Tax=Fulvivirga kasyanovii TaxID=396812 RepID=A0ABW9RYF7_9BACT|nr:TetR/AcrR family transcriptional regulator [Fulvivirga kasyanovii]MTI28751.1 TetR/AcrR family transcriptional regulator [Fulvivirga kasyanovii]